MFFLKYPLQNPQIECMAIGIEHKNKIEKVLKIYFNDLDTLY